jgi:hypothetical protein
MGKYDHIIELTGSEDFASWQRSVTLALQGDGLCNHCSNGTDPNNLSDFKSTIPVAAIPTAPTSAEKQEIKEWIKEDAQAKGIICRQLSPVIQSLLDENLSAHEQWDTLAQHFGCLDLNAQFEL